jgi:hypothetical protein
LPNFGAHAAPGGANKLRQEVRGKAETILGEELAWRMRSSARHLVEEAETKAAGLAGDALKGCRTRRSWSGASRARECCRRYGAEEGRRLKIVCKRILEAVRTDGAARRDYVEENRRYTAIRNIPEGHKHGTVGESERQRLKEQ